jgi:hypothetical protein
MIEAASGNNFRARGGAWVLGQSLLISTIIL